MTAGRQSVSSIKDWNTPPEYVEAVKQVLGEIALDPCSNEFSVVGAKHEWRLPEDSLTKEWNYPTIYVNPPFGRDKEHGTTIKHWLAKCTESRKKYLSEVIALVPVATNTKHWQDNIFLNAYAICFLRVPRLKFILAGEVVAKGAPMSCCFVYWGDKVNRFGDVFKTLGKVVLV